MPDALAEIISSTDPATRAAIVRGLGNAYSAGRLAEMRPPRWRARKDKLDSRDNRIRAHCASTWPGQSSRSQAMLLAAAMLRHPSLCKRLGADKPISKGQISRILGGERSVA